MIWKHYESVENNLLSNENKIMRQNVVNFIKRRYSFYYRNVENFPAFACGRVSFQPGRGSFDLSRMYHLE